MIYEEKDSENDSVVVECDGCHNHSIKIEDWSEVFDEQDAKSVIISFHCHDNRKRIWYCIWSRIKNACHYLIHGSITQSTDIVLDLKNAEKLSNKLSDLVIKLKK